jgi:hypothetical protein
MWGNANRDLGALVSRANPGLGFSIDRITNVSSVTAASINDRSQRGTATYVLEESGPSFFACVSPTFENARLHQFDELASEIDGIVACQFRLFLNAAGEVLHKAAAEAQPVRVDVPELLLAAIALGHVQPTRSLFRHPAARPTRLRTTWRPYQ